MMAFPLLTAVCSMILHKTFIYSVKAHPVLQVPLQYDSDEYIAIHKTMDPRLTQGLGSKYSTDALKPYYPHYKGMQHPPPKTGNPQCDKPWSVPFLPSYSGGRGKTLNLTMCNWYFPQGPNVPALHRYIKQPDQLVVNVGC
eukprot:GHRR01029191.1.p1 GENE.GHRR01029191.1~~GHRR01029191.1.p1  ORF type:complete len:141 (-),score=28.85 GHRR01029191.1:515-937(-)